MRKTNVKKFSLCLSSLLMFASLALLPNTRADPTKLSIVPENNVFYTTTTPINSTFIVNATVETVEDLYTWQIQVFFDPSIINCTNAWIPSDSPFNFDVDSPLVINPTEGWVSLGSSKLGDVPGTTASGTLACINFTIVKEPPPGGSVSCGINFSEPYGSQTFLLNSTLALIPAEIVNSRFEYLRPVPKPYLEVRPKLYKGLVGEEVVIEVWACNVSEDWEIIGFGFSLKFNATILNATTYEVGNWMNSFANDGEQISSGAYHDFMDFDPMLPGYNKWAAFIFIVPGTGGWIEPYPDGEGLLFKFHFDIIHDPPAYTPLELFESMIINTETEEIPHDVYSAEFVYSEYTLTITTTAGGTTDPEPNTYTYPSGSTVEVTAIPDPGYNFTDWKLNGTSVGSQNPVTITMNASYTLHAEFADLTAPVIYDPVQVPSVDNVLVDQPVQVSVNVTDEGSGVKNVTLNYRNDTTWYQIPMTLNTTTQNWTATIPGHPYGTNITYYIEAYDNAQNHAINNNATNYYIYTVIPEHPTPIPTIILITTITTITITLKKRKRVIYKK